MLEPYSALGWWESKVENVPISTKQLIFIAYTNAGKTKASKTRPNHIEPDKPKQIRSDQVRPNETNQTRPDKPKDRYS